MTEEDEEPLKEKKFRFYVIINWKTEDINVRKTEPKESKIGPYDYVIDQEVTMKIPKKKKTKVDIEVEMPQEKINEMVAEEI